MSASPSRPSYAALFRMAHTRRTFTTALIGRLSYGIVSLAMMLTVTRATGSYAVAGTVMALFGAMSVALSPARAALIDRYGPRRALIPMASLYATLLAAFAAAAWRPGAPVTAIGALAVAAGACTPPLGPTMRAVWSEVIEDKPLLQRAYSLDGVAEEILFVSGPLLVGVVVQFAPPAAGVALSALLVWAGTLAFVLSPIVAGVRPAAAKSAERSRRRLRGGRALVQSVVVAAGVGLSLGAIDLLVMAFAQQRHHGDDVVAWVLAALSVGSALGGLLNGAVNWRTSARVRLPLLAGGLGLALFAAGLAPGLGTLTVAVACAGFFVAPALTTSYLIADEAAPPGFRTQAGAWVNTAVNAGSSGGAAGVGFLVGHVSLGLCFAISGAAAAMAGLISVRGTGAAAVPRGTPKDAEEPSRV
ncbi:MFS transporter [Streptomyces sp. NBC_01236]|uniref:MFS transporter n=1 Tax=Streptomyces sp. NBC_01236 TaxID=2903789 RepID=UPI002E0FB0ED|nr:MFS transporter [Streptomyces sp. NBC_01236]